MFVVFKWLFLLSLLLVLLYINVIEVFVFFLMCRLLGVWLINKGNIEVLLFVSVFILMWLFWYFMCSVVLIINKFCKLFLELIFVDFKSNVLFLLL